MSAIFNFSSLLTCVLLIICTCAYVHAYAPSWLDGHKHGVRGIARKLAIIGERLSPFVSLGLIGLGVKILFFTP